MKETKWNRLRFQPCLPLGEDGRRVTSSEKHIDLAHNIAKEGIVLLKNDGILPLPTEKKIAIFGKAQIEYVSGGGGSGEVYPIYNRNVYEGFKVKEEEGKVQIFHKLSDFYVDYMAKAREEQPSLSKRMKNLADPEIPEELVKEAKENADIAVVTISRYSGEGSDRSSEKGDFYLSDSESKMIETVCKNFDNVIAIMNVGGMIDSEWFKNNDKIKGSLLIWNAGMEGGLATAEIVLGEVNPSGKLTDTFAKTFADYPSSESFNDSEVFVKYYEDIYVGYRYFETIPGAKEKVNYPFGYGLSYTTFEISDVKVSLDKEKIVAEASVKNTGDMAGKEVVQLYYSAPQGKLGKPARELAAFQKTSLIAPGESEKVALSFDINYMASYDDLGKCEKSAYILEGGEYTFHIGNSVRNTVKADFTYTVAEEFRVVEKLSERAFSVDLEKRMCADGTFEEMPRRDRKKPEIVECEALKPKEHAGKIMIEDVVDGKETLDDFVAQLDNDYIADLLGGKPRFGVSNVGGIGSRIVMEGVDDYGVPCALTTDGPAGIRITGHCGIPTTAFPCATLMACTWNLELMEEMGKRGAMEAKENNLLIWLTPALNIHRNPLCGRNFEYYSEDPFVSGKMAAAKIKGIQSQNIAATPKHFACNNKERNRRDSDSVVSERAIREIYIKGFEICVKESNPRALMTAYNPINGVRASENYDLITAILRGEWGYKGLVMTDWQTYSYQPNEITAGNDVRMPQGYTEAVSRTMGYYNPGFTGAAQQSAKRVLQLLLDFE
ncbi:MAG: beta-glucosidase [Ruminococcaceae bacterium]|nr:beta-glucosidase [Oscillospiraceae bacterium]